jgi:hypothetical protein
VRKDGYTAVASDPELDRVWIVDLDGKRVVGDVHLQPGDEPGRAVEDLSGRIHVVLRKGGALATIDPVDGSVTRRAVCPTPRGLAYDEDQDVIHVACADGTLATFPAAGGAALRTVRLDRDLRDVVITNGHLYVSRFRAAELLEVVADGTVAQRITLPPLTSGNHTSAPEVAYRTVALPSGDLLMLHQRAQVEAVKVDGTIYYGSGFDLCEFAGIANVAISHVVPGEAPAVAGTLDLVEVAVDLAVSPGGNEVAIALPRLEPDLVNVVTYSRSLVTPPDGTPPGCIPWTPHASQGQAIAVAYDAQGRLVTQTRDPAALQVGNDTILLPGTSMSSAGISAFYRDTTSGLTCASCHPEAGDDGHVWTFSDQGPRRTQNLRGGVTSRAPFHWSGDLANMPQLLNEVLVKRMAGTPLLDEEIIQLGAWLDAQPALVAPPPADPEAVARGRALFEDPLVGCTGCHDGPQLSNHQIVDVGTGAPFKVPSLIAVGYRAPYLHDGCAATLADRFGTTCGGGEQHGHTEQLDAGQIADLVSYLESL